MSHVENDLIILGLCPPCAMKNNFKLQEQSVKSVIQSYQGVTLGALMADAIIKFMVAFHLSQ